MTSCSRRNVTTLTKKGAIRLRSGQRGWARATPGQNPNPTQQRGLRRRRKSGRDPEHDHRNLGQDTKGDVPRPQFEARRNAGRIIKEQDVEGMGEIQHS